MEEARKYTKTPPWRGVPERIAKLKSEKAKALETASTDDLTGLPNRRGFFALAQNAFARSIRRREPVSFLFIDIDEFKKINDEHGHSAGDRVLKEMAEQLTTHVRGADQVCRLSGDELVVILENAEGENARGKAEDIMALTRSIRVPNGEEPLSVSVSIGIASRSPEDQFDIHELVRRADDAMYQAKQGGRDKIREYDSTGQNKNHI